MGEWKSTWQGGMWERENPHQPTPPPVVIPKISSYQENKIPETKLSTGAKVGFASFFTLLFVISCLAIVLGVQNYQGQEIPIFPEFFGEVIEIDPLEGVNRPPTIRAASWDTTTTLELEGNPKNSLTPQGIYSQNLPSIVFIEATSSGKTSTGTGVVMSEDGYIITNAHVIEDANKATVLLWNNMEYEARLVGYDFPQDLAVLKIEVEDLEPAIFGDSNLLSVGDPSYAMGNPLGANYRSTFTDGMVSAVNRVLTVEGNNLVLVQTTAAINSGNSGGALLNQYGQVVGITTIKIMSEQDTIEGMGFAIPSYRVKQVVDRIIAEEDTDAGTIGIKVGAVSDPVRGLLVSEFTYSDSNVVSAGMKTGDIILSANGTDTFAISDLNLVKCYLLVGDTIDYVVYRDGEEIEITAELEIFY
ncbi:MAG: trypsin-like peptidase domain-containing protein [Eubacteriales bacterium]